jgi:hypothetical protein
MEFLEHSGMFLNRFMTESWFNPLRGLRFARLWCFDSWFA